MGDRSAHNVGSRGARPRGSRGRDPGCPGGRDGRDGGRGGVRICLGEIGGVGGWGGSNSLYCFLFPISFPFVALFLTDMGGGSGSPAGIEQFDLGRDMVKGVKMVTAMPLRAGM